MADRNVKGVLQRETTIRKIQLKKTRSEESLPLDEDETPIAVIEWATFGDTKLEFAGAKGKLSKFLEDSGGWSSQ